MARFFKTRISPLVALTSMLVAAAPAITVAETESNKSTQNGELYVYNWYDFIAEDTVPNFEKGNGVKVTYDVYDSNEILEAKLLSGRSGYDLVFPSHDFLAKQIRAKVYEPLDKSKLKNYGNLNPVVMSMLAEIDPNNTYGIPYLSQTTGLAINHAKVEAVLGKNAPVDSWALVFEPENMAKLEKCGVAFVDAPTEVFATALKYMGKNPNSKDAKDYQAASKMLAKVMPHVRYFSPSRALTDLANGDICVAMTWTGDAMIATERAEEAGNGVEVEYIIPKEGAGVSIDMMAIPADARNKENAYKFIDYLLEPQVSADVTNYAYYQSPNKAAVPLVDSELRNNPNVFPTAEMEKNLFLFAPMDPKLGRVVTREWTRLTTGN